MNLGQDETRGHGIDADTLAGNLLRQTDRHRVDGALRGGIPDVLARTAERRGG